MTSKDTASTHDGRSRRARTWLAVLAVLHCGFTAGCLFGWPAIMTMLNREGHYAALCAQEGTPSCNAVDVYSAQIYAEALAVQSFAALPLGLLLDWLGPRGAFLYQLICIAGLATMTVAKTPYAGTGIDPIRVGFILLCLSGIAMVTLHLHISNLFASFHSVYAAIVASSYGLTSMVFSSFDLLHATRTISATGLLRIELAILIAFAVFTALLPAEKFRLGDQCTFRLGLKHGGRWGYMRVSDTLKRLPKPDTRHDGAEAACINNDGAAAAVARSSSFEEDDIPASSTGRLTAALRRFLRLCLRRKFVFLTVAAVAWYFIASFYIASLHLQLSSIAYRILNLTETPAMTAPPIGDVDPTLGRQVELINRLFTWLVCLGCLFAAGGGIIAHRVNFGMAWLAQTIVGLVHLLLQTVPNLWVQLAVFVTYTGLQEMFFALTCSYIGLRVSLQYQNSLVGVILLFCGACNLLVEPIVRVLVATRPMATLFRPTLIAFIAVALLGLSYPYYLYRTEGIAPLVGRGSGGGKGALFHPV